MMASSVSLLTRRLASTSISTSGSAVRLPLLAHLKTFAAVNPLNEGLAVRHFAAKGKVNKKKKNLERNRKVISADADADKGADSNVQHEEWVKFQQSIQIDGFETGQTTVVQKGIGKKRRGGKAVRKRLESKGMEQAAAEMANFTVGGGQYAPLRYSEEETQRLLAEAYANIPKRDGKRGTRNLQRQSNRWHAVRKSRKIAKRNYGIKQHERRMAKRSHVVAAVKQVKADAPAIRTNERAYQQHVMERWTHIMLGDHENVIEEGVQKV